jgi:hypothetical protein
VEHPARLRLEALPRPQLPVLPVLLVLALVVPPVPQRPGQRRAHQPRC